MRAGVSSNQWLVVVKGIPAGVAGAGIDVSGGFPAATTN
jgi:hypothetical protein